MPITFILKSANSDLTGGADFTKRIDENVETASTISVQLAPGGGNEDSLAFTPSGTPGTLGVTGDYTVEVNVTSAGASTTCQVAVARVNSAGTQQAISAFTATQSTASTGVKTFTLTGIDLGTWAAGDRLKVIYRFRNSHNSQTRTVVIETGTTDTQVIAPWAPPASLLPLGLTTDLAPGSVPPSETAPARTRGMGSGITVEPPLASQLRVSWFYLEVPLAAGTNVNPLSLTRSRALGAPVAQWAVTLAPASLVHTRAQGAPVVTSGAPKSTGIARLSLAAGGEPQSRTNHAIVVNARKTNAAHAGILRLQLFEGAAAITGVLETAELTDTLAGYTLTLTDPEAASIGSYDDLELRLQGFSIDGDATVFEVSEVWLQTPSVLPVVEPGSLEHTRAIGTTALAVGLVPAGLSRIRSLGSIVLNTTVGLAALVRTRGQGTITVSSVSQVAPAALEHTRAQGAATVSPSIGPAGLVHTRALGDASVTISGTAAPASIVHTRDQGALSLNPSIQVGSMTQTRALGTISVSSAAQVAATSLVHARAQGALSLNPTVTAASLVRTRALGDPTVASANQIVTASLTRTRAQGAATVSPSLGVASLTRTRAIGSPSLAITFTPDALVHARAQGSPALSPTVAVSSIVHGRASDAPTVSSATTVTATSLVHTRAFSAVAVSPSLGPAALVHTRAQGSPTVSPTVPLGSLVHARAQGNPILGLLQVEATSLVHSRTLGVTVVTDLSLSFDQFDQGTPTVASFDAPTPTKVLA